VSSSDAAQTDNVGGTILGGCGFSTAPNSMETGFGWTNSGAPDVLTTVAQISDGNTTVTATPTPPAEPWANFIICADA
jgi:hypothetical protein